MKKTTINTELTAIDMLNEVLSDLDALEHMSEMQFCLTKTIE
mgnify:CR=1 FL=1